MNRTLHHVVGLIEIEPRSQHFRPTCGDDANLASTLARLAVSAAARLEGEPEEADALEEHLDHDREADESPLVGEPLRASAADESLSADTPRLLRELSLLYTMVRGEALLRRFAR